MSQSINDFSLCLNRRRQPSDVHSRFPHERYLSACLSSCFGRPLVVWILFFMDHLSLCGLFVCSELTCLHLFFLFLFSMSDSETWNDITPQFILEKRKGKREGEAQGWATSSSGASPSICCRRFL